MKFLKKFNFFDSLPFYLLVSNHKPVLSIYILYLDQCDVESAADLTGQDPSYKDLPQPDRGACTLVFF